MPHFGLTDATRLLSAAPNPLSAGRNDAELASPSTTIRYAVHQQRTDVIVFAYVIPPLREMEEAEADRYGIIMVQ